jgi:hypothetical protein
MPTESSHLGPNFELHRILIRDVQKTRVISGVTREASRHPPVDGPNRSVESDEGVANAATYEVLFVALVLPLPNGGRL